MSNAFWNLWPEIESRTEAIQVSRQGVWAAIFSCAITALVSVLSIFGFDWFSLLDAAIFAVIAWRIYRLSLPWSIAGLVFFVAERIFGLYHSAVKVSFVGWIVAALLTLCYMNSVRATSFLHKNKEAPVALVDTPINNEVKSEEIEVTESS
jgi:hypothetical protein